MSVVVCFWCCNNHCNFLMLTLWMSNNTKDLFDAKLTFQYNFDMPAYTVNIQYPGTFLDLSDTKVADDVNMLISTMNSQLTDAALVLNCYEKEKRKFMKVIRAQPEPDLAKARRYSQFFHHCCPNVYFLLHINYLK
jgi:hypothetical protein